MSEIILNSHAAKEAFKAYIDTQWEKEKYLRVTVKKGKQRTLTQNASLHKFCTMVAEALNDAGYDFREFVKEGYPVPWNEQLAKDYIWRPIQKAMTGKDSTTKPETHEYGQIYEVVNLKLAEYGIHVPWPCKDTREAMRRAA